MKKVNSILQVAQCLMNQEITINTDFESPTSGYVVSKYGGLVLDEPDLDKVITFVRDNYYYILNRAGWYFGSWKDDGKLYVDISYVCKYKETAIALGRVEKQIAIWDVEKKEAITL